MRHDHSKHRLTVRWWLFGLAVLLTAGCAPVPLEGDDVSRPDTRGLRPRRAWTGTGFEPGQSLGIFVGVRRFPKDDQLAEVPYAVDDAVDLAYVFALELGLVSPERVHLLLSGEPQKQETGNRLRQLKDAGAQVGTATRSDLIKAVDRQTRQAGPQGLLLISFATHGFSHEGVHYLMPEDSLVGDVEATGFASNRLLEAVGQARTPRRIVLLDACRQKVVGARSGSDPRAAVPRQLSDAIAGARGEVILSAARLGGFAFDDEAQGNGVFTGAILDGLRCGASRDRRGFVTIETLTGYVDRRVTEWVEIHQGPDPGWPPGIESTLGGPVRDLPLVACSEIWTPPPAPLSPPPPLGCAALTLDLDEGTLAGLAPNASRSTIARSLPCQTETVDGVSGLGSVNYPDYGIRFLPDEERIEFDRNFQGSILADGKPVSLLGNALPANFPFQYQLYIWDGPRSTLFELFWGCLQLNFSAGKVIRISVHGRYCHAVPLRKEIGVP